MPRDDYTGLIWEYRRKQRELMAALKGLSWGHGSTPHYYVWKVGDALALPND